MALCLTPLFSGSSGNAILVSSPRTKVLIDAGVSCRKLEKALHSIGEAVDDIKGILITHEHSDHIQGVGILSRRYNIPVYATAPTWEAACDKLGSVRSALARVIGKEPFYIDDLLIEPFEIPHDAQTRWATASRAATAVLRSPPTRLFPQEGAPAARLRSGAAESNHDLKCSSPGATLTSSSSASGRAAATCPTTTRRKPPCGCVRGRLVHTAGASPRENNSSTSRSAPSPTHCWKWHHARARHQQSRLPRPRDGPVPD